MKATTSIDTAEAISRPTTSLDGDENPVLETEQARGIRARAAERGRSRGKPEPELRASGCGQAARAYLEGTGGQDGRECGLTAQVATGCRPWPPMLRDKVMQVLGEVPGGGRLPARRRG